LGPTRRGCQGTVKRGNKLCVPRGGQRYETKLSKRAKKRKNRKSVSSGGFVEEAYIKVSATKKGEGIESTKTFRRAESEKGGRDSLKSQFASLRDCWG